MTPLKGMMEDDRTWGKRTLIFRNDLRIQGHGSDILVDHEELPDSVEVSSADDPQPDDTHPFLLSYCRNRGRRPLKNYLVQRKIPGLQHERLDANYWPRTTGHLGNIRLQVTRGR